MQARRIAVPESGDINEVFGDLQPGDYCGPVIHRTSGNPAVYFKHPGSHPHGLAHCESPPHVFRECSDWSLEIRESLLVDSGARGTWHGFLDEGNVWREV